MSTELLYMNDFDVTDCEAVVVVVEKSEDLYDVVLDQTCLYAKGGGQDYDTGKISSAGKDFNVSSVRLDADGVVHHYGQFETEAFSVGDKVNCIVDQARRKLNTRLHSAGHLVDMAVSKISPDWLAVKAAHFPHQSFVDYEGNYSPDNRQETIDSLNSALDQLTEAGGQNEIQFMSVDDMAKICRNVPQNIPTNKPSRVVVYPGEFGIPCGGTHVKDIEEIGNVTVTKIKNKSGLIHISYAITD